MKKINLTFGFLVIAFLLKAGSITYLRISDNLTLNPYESNDFFSNETLSNIVEPLVDYDLQNRSFVPLLAESWLVENNFRVWIFNLRRNIYFHNGQPLNAAVVADSLNKSRNLLANFPFRKKYLFERLRKIEVVNEERLRLEFNSEFPNLLSFLCTIQNAIVHPDSYKNKPFIPIGTGPFKVELGKADRTILTKNTNYWRSSGNLEKIIFRTVTEPHRRITAILSAQADVTAISSPLEFNELSNAKNLRIISHSSLSVHYLAFNTKSFPFNRREARRAVQLSLDLEKIIPYVYQKTARAAHSILPPALYFRGYSPATCPIDPKKAAEYLKKAGVSEKTTIDLYYGLGMDSTNLLIERITLGLRKIGLEINRRGFNFKELLLRLNRGEHQMALLGWTEDVDPLLSIYPLFAREKFASNRSFFSDSRLDKLFSEAFSACSEEEKERLLLQIMNLLEDEIPVLPLFHLNDSFCHRENLSGLEIGSKGYLLFRNAFQEKK